MRLTSHFVSSAVALLVFEAVATHSLSFARQTTQDDRVQADEHDISTPTRQLTNSERFREGLGPNKPKRLFDPSRTKGNTRHSSSPQLKAKYPCLHLGPALQIDGLLNPQGVQSRTCATPAMKVGVPSSPAQLPPPWTVTMASLPYATTL